MSSAPLHYTTAALSFKPGDLLFLSFFFSSRSSRRAAVFIWYSHQYLRSDSTVPVDLFTCMATWFLCLQHSLQHIAAVLCQDCGQDTWASGVGEGRFPTAMQLCWQGAVPFVPWASVDYLHSLGHNGGSRSCTSGPFGSGRASCNWQNTCTENLPGRLSAVRIAVAVFVFRRGTAFDLL